MEFYEIRSYFIVIDNGKIKVKDSGFIWVWYVG